MDRERENAIAIRNHNRNQLVQSAPLPKIKLISSLILKEITTNSKFTNSNAHKRLLACTFNTKLHVICMINYFLGLNSDENRNSNWSIRLNL